MPTKGSSICIDASGIFHVFEHNFEYKDDGKSDFYEFVKKNGFVAKLREYRENHSIETITVHGEWCGEGIQKNRMQLKKPDWFIFTVDFNGRRQNWKVINETADFIQAHTVPLEEEGNDFLSAYPDEASLLIRSSENRCHAYPGQCEGIVIRPSEPHYSEILRSPLSMKVINNKYLLKK